MSITSSTLGKRTFKVILLGQTSTGKTSIIQRFVNHKFDEKDNPTIGIDFLGKNITQNSTGYRLQLWDTAGQQRYRCLIPSYLKDAVCAIFVFDQARNQTLVNLQTWIDLFRQSRGDRAVVAICGNKNDLKKDFDQEILKGYIQKYKMRYYETSALTGCGIQSMFALVIQDIVASQQAKIKSTVQDEDNELYAPMTNCKLKSQKKQGEKEADQQEDKQKIGCYKGILRKKCCGTS